MKKFSDWWKQDKRYVTMIKAVLLGVLPVLCCLVYCAMQGKTIGQVYLPESEWNDELFYFKQVEGIVNYGYPLGYFGFNESHALKLSFAAWSPVLVFPWILWGLLFGWNLMSPVICNILLMTICCFVFVWLTKPTWKQLGVLALLFCLYTPFVRYMLSTMPEIICFSMLILFYGLAINYLKREKTYKLMLLFLMSGVMTLMRPYALVFMLLPAYFWVRKNRVKGLLGSVAVYGVVLGIYACIKHYLGAEYFAPLFFTDWVEAFFEQGFVGGLKFTLSKLYYMGASFKGHTIEGFRSGLASGAFFAGYLVMMLVLLGQSLADWSGLRRVKRLLQPVKSADAENPVEGNELSAAEMRSVERAGEAVRTGSAENVEEAVRAGSTESAEETAGKTESVGINEGELRERIGKLRNQLTIEIHLVLCFVAMLFALLLMYKLTEGSKHLLTFMAAGVFVVSMMETRFFKKAVVLGVTFVYFYTYMAIDPYDYQVPFLRQERQAQLEHWEEIFEEEIVLNREQVPSFENDVIWVFNDETDSGTVNTAWQVLYALPEGSGISCCMRDYVVANLETLESKYLVTVSGGEIDEMCEQAGYEELGRDEDVVLYRRY